MERDCGPGNLGFGGLGLALGWGFRVDGFRGRGLGFMLGSGFND